MNPHSHAEHSAHIFGGTSEDYLNVHQIIDINKAASLSMFGRFMMHHIDVGSKILERIYGSNTMQNSEGKMVQMKELLCQHLIENYGMVPVFNDWLESFGFFDPNNSGFIDRIPQEQCLQILREDSMFKHTTEKDFNKMFTRIEKVFSLAAFTDDEQIIGNPWSSCVFAHATGIQLGVLAIGPKINGRWTEDVLCRYLDATFKEPSFRGRMLTDYTECLTQKEWMCASKNPYRYNPDHTKVAIQQIRQYGIPSDKKGTISTESATLRELFKNATPKERQALEKQHPHIEFSLVV